MFRCSELIKSGLPTFRVLKSMFRLKEIETSNIKVLNIQKEKGKTSSATYDNTIVFIFYYLACYTPMRSNHRSSIRILIAKISCDVSVNECQSNNTKDITCLMIDRTRKARGLLQDK